MGLQKITVEEAEELIKVSQDTFDQAKYYTITPSIDPQKRAEGWEAVTYYSERRRSYQIPTSVPNAQWVYVLSNESMPDMVKIGYTNKTPDERVGEINRATGVPTDFIVEYALPCVNGYEVEQLVHKELDDYRVNGKKEFFKLKVEEAKQLINAIGEPYTISN